MVPTLVHFKVILYWVGSSYNHAPNIRSNSQAFTTAVLYKLSKETFFESGFQIEKSTYLCYFLVLTGGYFFLVQILTGRRVFWALGAEKRFQFQLHPRYQTKCTDVYSLS